MDREEGEKRKILRKMGNPLWGVFWRFLVCCAVIDALLLGYFNLIKGITLVEGLKQWQAAVASNKQKPEVHAPKQTVAENIAQPPNAPRKPA